MKLLTKVHRCSTRICYAIGLTERTELDEDIRTAQERYEQFGQSLREFCDKMTSILPSKEKSRFEAFASTLDFIAVRTDRTLVMHRDISDLKACMQAIAEAERTLQSHMESKVLKPSRDFFQNEWKQFKTAERELAQATIDMDRYKSKLMRLIKSDDSYQKGYEKAFNAYEQRLKVFVSIVNKLGAQQEKHAERIKEAIDLLIEYHKLALRKFRIYIALP